MSRKLAILVVALVVAALLAFWLRDAIYVLCVRPLIDALLVLGLVLRMFSQATYWTLLVVAATLIALAALLSRLRPEFGRAAGRGAAPGPVEALAGQIELTRRGPYLKWMVANQLGELARAMLARREGSEQAAHGRLSARGWDPPAEVQGFLEAGLDRAPLGRARRRGLGVPGWGAPPPALDADLEQVIDYLESQMETRT